MKRLSYEAFAIGLAAGIAGCAAPSPTTPSAAVPSPPAKVIAADRATDAVAIGKSGKADVAATLGETQAIRFESGFEIWIYRLAGGAPTSDASARRTPRPAAERPAPGTSGASGEFVVLFAPSGLAAKTRIRPAAP